MNVMTKLFLGADHGGFELKEKIKSFLKEKKIDFIDLGAYELREDDDYPFVALEMALRVKKEGGKGILFCRSGVGMSVVANKVKGVRSADVFSPEMAQKAVEHNDCQIISIASDFLTEERVKEIIEAFLYSGFSQEDRHKRRLKEILLFESKALKITPALLEPDKKTFQEKIQVLKEAGISEFHLDVLKEPFYGRSFYDPDLFSGFEIEVHLMGKEIPYDILRHKEVKRFIWQVEYINELEFIKLKERGFIMGVSLDLDSKPELLDPYIPNVEIIQIMGVKAGRSGQDFHKSVLKKIQIVREKTEKEIVVDGGIDYISSQLVKMAGADRVVARSYLFEGDIRENLKELQ